MRARTVRRVCTEFYATKPNQNPAFVVVACVFLVKSFLFFVSFLFSQKVFFSSLARSTLVKKRGFFHLVSLGERWCHPCLTPRLVGRVKKRIEPAAPVHRNVDCRKIPAATTAASIRFRLLTRLRKAGMVGPLFSQRPVMLLSMSTLQLPLAPWICSKKIISGHPKGRPRDFRRGPQRIKTLTTSRSHLRPAPSFRERNVLTPSRLCKKHLVFLKRVIRRSLIRRKNTRRKAKSHRDKMTLLVLPPWLTILPLLAWKWSHLLLLVSLECLLLLAGRLVPQELVAKWSRLPVSPRKGAL